MTKEAQAEQMRSGAGFIAALDQSGGSTPKALALYGVTEADYSGDAQMFDQIHTMRARIASAPAFTGDQVIGAILFERTMNSEISGKPSANFLWEDRQVVPFLKIDKGLADPADGVKPMKPIDGLDDLLTRGAEAGIFGTKMRSVIDGASPTGIDAIVAQQFDVGQQVLSHGMVPIIEPEVTITIEDKAQAEDLLLASLTRVLDAIDGDKQIMLKLTLPEVPNHYLPLVNHPNVMRVVALSGGYSRDEANERLSVNRGVIASFSRALTEGLSVQQSDDDFNRAIAATISSISNASMAG